jgi:hypothetical protein
MAVDWGEVTAIATSVLAIGLLGGIGAAVFAAQQVREARRSREAQMAAEFFRRWNEDALVETRRMVARFASAEELREAYTAYVARDADEAWVLYRELDYFEQLAALESQGAFDLQLIKVMLGRTLIDRWQVWQPAVLEAHGPGTYPMLESLVEKLRYELGEDPAVGRR